MRWQSLAQLWEASLLANLPTRCPVSRPRLQPADRRALKRLRKPALTVDEFDRLRSKVGRVTCSAAWRDESTREADRQGIAANCRRVPQLLASYGIYPPPAARVRMVRCDLCDHVFPPAYIITCNLFRLCADCAIAPQCPRDTLGHLSEGARRRRVYRQLRQLALNDREIAVLSLRWDGLSLRAIAEFSRLGKTQVHRLVVSAKRKLTEAGHPFPIRQPAAAERHGREVLLDPRELDRMAAAPA